MEKDQREDSNEPQKNMDGEDCHIFHMIYLKNLGLAFQDTQTVRWFLWLVKGAQSRLNSLKSLA